MINKPSLQPLVVLFSTCFLWVHASFAQDKKNALPGNADQQVYEAIGVMISHGSGLHKMGFDSDQQKAILKGLAKGFNLDTIPPEIQSLQPKIQEIMMKKMQAVRQAAQAEQAKDAMVNKEKAKEFFALLSSQKGVQKDPSGFYYEILQPGKGATPTMDDTVRLHYHGTLTDGTVFDSSVERGEPASFPMNGVIKGFSGGLTKTQVGGKIRIYIPSELGYGDNPRPGGMIKPGDTLIFECELLEIL
jgi:FKBP-type peptidyl-prolyl cis-trans isomerase